MNEQRTIIEVNGVKLDVDLRTARRIDTLTIGDRVKVLVKEAYGDGCKVHPGVVCGFEPFTTLPTIIVAYLEIDWQEAKLKFAYLNAQTKGVEVIKAIDNDALDLDKSRVLDMLDKQIAAKQVEIAEIERRKDYFLREFGAYWTPVMEPEVAA